MRMLIMEGDGQIRRLLEQLLAQKGVHLHVLAIAFRIRRVAFGEGDVIGSLLKGLFPAVPLLEQGAVYHQIGIAPDR